MPVTDLRDRENAFDVVFIVVRHYGPRLILHTQNLKRTETLFQILQTLMNRFSMHFCCTSFIFLC